jgi:hypothetical protein
MTTKKLGKSDGMEHRKSSKPEKQYVRGIVHNLSLQRLTDQKIVDYLHDEKNIDMARTTVNGIKNQIEKHAEKWYIELEFYLQIHSNLQRTYRFSFFISKEIA